MQEQTWKFLRGKGLPEKAVAAVMGNIEAESSFDPKLVEKANGIGFGLCQWSFGRRTQLEKYGTTLNHQLEFLWAELSGNGASQIGAKFEWINKSQYLKHDDFMSANGSIATLTTAFCFCWERPKVSTAHLERRQKKANEYYTQFTGLQGEYTPGAEGVGGGGSEVGGNTVPEMEIEETNYEVVKGSEKIGDYLFGRRYRITVSNEDGKTIDISQLHCTFSILKTMQMEPNTSEIAIYNLNAQTENDIKMNGTRITVEAGYEGTQFGLLFDGDIFQCIQEKENAHTFKLTIIALDSDRAINFEIANFSVLRGQSHREIVENIINVAQFPMELGSISEKLNNTKLTRGKVMMGKSSNYLDQIAKSNKLQFYMDDGKVNLIDLEDLPDDEIVKLSPNSGLIGVPEQTDFGVSGQCLLNPQIKINTLIHIEGSLIKDKRIEFGVANTVPSVSNDSAGVSGAPSESGGQLSLGGYLIPYNGSFPITSPFGMRGKKMHSGIDIGMPTGTPLYASKSGTVLKAGIDSKGVNSGGGKIVMLTHPDGSATNYFHLSEWKVNTDASVKQGDLIGISGNTGFSSGPHLHFEIAEGGKKKDPKSVINGGTGESVKSAPPSVPSEPQVAGDTEQTNTQTTSTSGSVEHTHSLIRGLDKEGIYRVVKLEYQGDTRGNDWFVSFQTISQIGGAIPIIST